MGQGVLVHARTGITDRQQHIGVGFNVHEPPGLVLIDIGVGGLDDGLGRILFLPARATTCLGPKVRAATRFPQPSRLTRKHAFVIAFVPEKNRSDNLPKFDPYQIRRQGSSLVSVFGFRTNAREPQPETVAKY